MENLLFRRGTRVCRGECVSEATCTCHVTAYYLNLWLLHSILRRHRLNRGLAKPIFGPMHVVRYCLAASEGHCNRAMSYCGRLHDKRAGDALANTLTPSKQSLTGNAI